MMNKKAKGNLLIGILIALVAVGVGTFIYFGVTSQTAITDPEQITEQTQASKEGEIVTFKAYAVNATHNNPSTRCAGTGYFWNKDEPTKLLGGGSVSLLATASTTVKPVTLGKTVVGTLFDSNAYSDEVEKFINSEGEEMKLKSYRITTAMTYRVEEDGAVETSPTISLGANEEDAFNKFVVSQTTADSQARLKMITFQSNESTANTNIQDMKVTGLTGVPCPISLKASHFCFEWDELQILDEFDEIETGSVTLVGSSSGCHARGEEITVTYVDEQAYVSVDGSIKYGVEDDSPSHSDVGWTNTNMVDYLNCTA